MYRFCEKNFLLVCGRSSSSATVSGSSSIFGQHTLCVSLCSFVHWNFSGQLITFFRLLPNNSIGSSSSKNERGWYARDFFSYAIY